MISCLIRFTLRPGRDTERRETVDRLMVAAHELDGFISKHTYAAPDDPTDLFTVSLWRDEQALKAWMALPVHREAIAQAKELFTGWQIQIAEVVREYGWPESSVPDRPEPAAHQPTATAPVGEPEWTDVASVTELAEARRMRVTVAGEDIALFHAKNKIYALRDTCIHQQQSISEGKVLRGKVSCPGHQWTFSLKTGWEADQGQRQPSYPVRIDDGRVLVLGRPRTEAELAEIEAAS